MTREPGFTLIEVLVAVALFGIVTAGMVPAFLVYLKQNVNAQIKTEAAMAAQQKLDELRVEDPSDLPSSGSDPIETIKVGDHDFDILVTYCADPSYCALDTKQISVEVNYKEKRVYALQTVYTDLR